jgi:hypothetical protein
MQMSWKNAVALALAGAVTLGVTTPLSAATRSNTGAANAAASKSVLHRRAHARVHREQSWYGDRFAPAGGSYAYAPGPGAYAPGAYAPGSWHINQNGLPYRVPEDCAYPIGYGSDGAAIFQRFGCPLP